MLKSIGMKMFMLMLTEIGKMKTFVILEKYVGYADVTIEAESEEEARELAHADINSHEVIAESTTDWDIDEVILEDEEWYNK